MQMSRRRRPTGRPRRAPRRGLRARAAGPPRPRSRAVRGRGRTGRCRSPMRPGRGAGRAGRAAGTRRAPPTPDRGARRDPDHDDRDPGDHPHGGRLGERRAEQARDLAAEVAGAQAVRHARREPVGREDDHRAGRGDRQVPGAPADPADRGGEHGLHAARRSPPSAAAARPGSRRRRRSARCSPSSSPGRRRRRPGCRPARRGTSRPRGCPRRGRRCSRRSRRARRRTARSRPPSPQRRALEPPRQGERGAEPRRGRRRPRPGGEQAGAVVAVQGEPARDDGGRRRERQRQQEDPQPLAGQRARERPPPQRRQPRQPMPAGRVAGRPQQVGDAEHPGAERVGGARALDDLRGDRPDPGEGHAHRGERQPEGERAAQRQPRRSPRRARSRTRASTALAATATTSAEASGAWRPTTPAPTSSPRPVSSSARVWRTTAWKAHQRHEHGREAADPPRRQRAQRVAVDAPVEGERWRGLPAGALDEARARGRRVVEVRVARRDERDGGAEEEDPGGHDHAVAPQREPRQHPHARQQLLMPRRA